MPHVLIRNVPAEVLAAIDANARRVGLSRSEYLRRALARERRQQGTVTVEDLAVFAERFGDLADEAVMDQAWR